MALITFKDLPDTSTPLNAENLNANFQRDIITIGLASDTNVRITSDYVSAKIPFNKLSGQAGTKLKLENNGVRIPSNTKKIKVSARETSVGDESSSSYGIYLFVNEKAVCQIYDVATRPGDYSATTINETIISVNGGELVTLQLYCDSAGHSRNMKAFDGTATSLTVEIVE